jgi:muramoyltetrapeptide carboxypeptidase
MDRRSFIFQSSILGLSTSVASLPLKASQANVEIIKPKALPKNARVGLITPGSALTRSAFEKTIQNLEIQGYEVVFSPNLRVRSGFLSGTDEQRVSDIHKMFDDTNIDGIFCARGGYGCGRLVDKIDYDIIKDNPKPFIGYSDITALHSAFYHHTGLITFHGPVGASEWNDFSADYVFDVLHNGKKVKIRADETQVIAHGQAEGKLVGGNLTLLTSQIGTTHDPDYDGHILFIEEVGEATYRIDRMLTQLLSSGKLDKVKGIALGYFTDCDVKNNDPGFEYSIGLQEVFADRLGQLGVPVVYGFPFGHEPHNCTLPIGIKAELNSDKGMLKLLESAVV